MERRGNLGRPFLMVYYEETKLINNWQLDRVLVLSSAEAPSVEKRRENGELKNRGRQGAPLISPLPIPQPTGKTKESSAEERALLVHF